MLVHNSNTKIYNRGKVMTTVNPTLTLLQSVDYGLLFDHDDQEVKSDAMGSTRTKGESCYIIDSKDNKKIFQAKGSVILYRCAIDCIESTGPIIAINCDIKSIKSSKDIAVYNIKWIKNGDQIGVAVEPLKKTPALETPESVHVGAECISGLKVDGDIHLILQEQHQDITIARTTGKTLNLSSISRLKLTLGEGCTFEKVITAKDAKVTVHPSAHVNTMMKV
jgi:hypothetical protein